MFGPFISCGCPFGAMSVLQRVSSLTLGGGGLGQVWGKSSRSEAVDTVRLALSSGINHLDVAPIYGNGEAERCVGEALAGRLPRGVMLSTKVALGSPRVEDVEDTVRTSLRASLDRLGLPCVTLLLLHSNIVPDGEEQAFSTTWTVYTKVRWLRCSRGALTVVPGLHSRGRSAEAGRCDQALGHHRRGPPSPDTAGSAPHAQATGHSVRHQYSGLSGWPASEPPKLT